MAEALAPGIPGFRILERPAGIDRPFYQTRYDANRDLQAAFREATAPLELDFLTPASFREYRVPISAADFTRAGFKLDSELEDVKKAMMLGGMNLFDQETPFRLRLMSNGASVINPAYANVSLGANLADGNFSFFPTISKDSNRDYPDTTIFRVARGAVGQDVTDYDSERRNGVPHCSFQLSKEAEIVKATINLIGGKISQGAVSLVYDSDKSLILSEQEGWDDYGSHGDMEKVKALMDKGNKRV